MTASPSSDRAALAEAAVASAVADAWAAFDLPPMGESRLCHHGETELRRRSMGDGQTRLMRQCLACGEAGGPAVPLRSVPDFAALPPWNENLARDFFARWTEASRAAKAAEWRARRAVYDDYLKSEDWRSRRDRVLARSPICQACERRPAQEVHHLTYDRIYREPLFDLVAICSGCHRALHAADGAEGTP